MALGWRRLVARLRGKSTAPPLLGERLVDVRPILAAEGCGPPLTAVLAAACDVPVGGRLRVIAPFDPAPMRAALRAEGFQGAPTQPRDGGFEILFTRMGAPAPRQTVARGWRDADGAHLDLRGLAAPAPMVEILRALDSGGEDGPLTAWLDRDPLHLYPELAARGWAWELGEQGGGFVLRIARESPR